MNNFANMENNSGLLKDDYGDKEISPLQLALKKKREKLAETQIGLISEEE